MYKKLNIPVCFTAPNSYDVAACELLFAAFKRDDINPRKFKTGKS